MCHALQVISKMHINFHIWQFLNLYPLYMGKNEDLRIRVYFLIFPQYIEIWGGGGRGAISPKVSRIHLLNHVALDLS